MNGLPIHDESARKIGYFIFMDRNEKTVLCVKGILDNTINGYLILTNKKLFSITGQMLIEKINL